MGKKFCSKCGHGNEAMSGGLTTKKCSQCGTSLESLAAFGGPPKRSTVGTRGKKSRFSGRQRQEEEEYWDDEESEFPDINSMLSNIELDIDVGRGISVKLGDLSKQQRFKAGSALRTFFSG